MLKAVTIALFVFGGESAIFTATVAYYFYINADCQSCDFYNRASTTAYGFIISLVLLFSGFLTRKIVNRREYRILRT